MLQIQAPQRIPPFSNYTFAKLDCEKCFGVKLVTMDGELCVVRVIVPKIAQRWMMERA